MIDIIKMRLSQGRRTIGFPKTAPVLPDRFRGLPRLDSSKCGKDCADCVETCPVDAITLANGSEAGLRKPHIDLGRCLFCGACQRECAGGAITFTQEYSLAARKRGNLVINGKVFEKAEALEKSIRKIFKRSLKLRQVSAGGCNGCEVDINVLGTTVFDLGRFGIQIVASPRHADALIVTGAVSENMRLGLLKTFKATPAPKLVIAVGACAISGGIFRGNPQIRNGVEGLLPIDLYIPGCPPHPITILDGLLRLLDR